MNSPQLDILNEIRSLETSDLSFVIFRYPDEKEFHLLETGHAERISKNELGEKKGFIVFPFTDEPGYLLQQGNGKVLRLGEEKKNLNNFVSKEDYLKLAESFIACIREGKFRKLVLSRIKKINRQESLQEADIFFRLCEKYPSAFVYYGRFPEYGTWMGATPETLIKSDGKHIRIMSLAGTQIHHNKAEHEIQWGEKEREEQAIVTRAIQASLEENQFGPVHVSAPYTHRAGHLVHLRSDITIAANAHTDLARLITLLHPTPAVGGFPKKEAWNHLIIHEPHERSLYSGFLGTIEEKGKCNLFVNLRCMQIHKDSIDLFVGGGITADSQPELEWEETEQKARTLESVITSNIDSQ